MIAIANPSGATAPDKIEAVTTGASATFDYSTTQLDKAIVDTNPTTLKTVPFNGGIAAGGATTKVTTDPASGHEAIIRDLAITNTHASASGTVQLQHTINGGTARKITPAISLAPGERIQLNADGTLFVYDATGGVKNSLAAAMTRTVLAAAGSGTYNTPVGCRAIDVICIGGAGGSAACAARIIDRVGLGRRRERFIRSQADLAAGGLVQLHRRRRRRGWRRPARTRAARGHEHVRHLAAVRSGWRRESGGHRCRD
jgi:hypothetical protein